MNSQDLIDAPLRDELDLALPGLTCANAAALTAVVAPEVVMTQGRLIDTRRMRACPRCWLPPRLRRLARHDILGTTVSGTLTLPAFRLVLRW